MDAGCITERIAGLHAKPEILEAGYRSKIMKVFFSKNQGRWMLLCSQKEVQVFMQNQRHLEAGYLTNVMKVFIPKPRALDAGLLTELYALITFESP